MDSMIAHAVLSLDLVALSEEEKIKTTHSYFIQACSQPKKTLKPKMNTLFREILELPAGRLS